MRITLQFLVAFLFVCVSLAYAAKVEFVNESGINLFLEWKECEAGATKFNTRIKPDEEVLVETPGEELCYAFGRNYNEDRTDWDSADSGDVVELNLAAEAEYDEEEEEEYADDDDEYEYEDEDEYYSDEDEDDDEYYEDGHEYDDDDEEDEDHDDEDRK